MKLQSISVSSFNIRCYGLNGEYDGKYGDERRDEKLKAFMAKHIFGCDVMFFQEIIDAERFKTLLPQEYKVFCYKHEYKRHQKIIIAYKQKFQLCEILENEPTIASVAVNEKTSRPALICKLIYEGEAIVNLVGVHLKSGSTHTHTRVLQSQKITEYLRQISGDLPSIVAGDFNTRVKEVTGQNDNDVEILEKIFEPINLKRVPNQSFTYRTPWEEHCLDHFWVSKNLCDNNSFWVYNADEYADSQDIKQTLQTYYQEISDHLPIKINLQIS